MKPFQIDGYAGLKAFLPPVERRGLVLIDPPFEAADEFAKAVEALAKAWRKWATGIYMLWYPVKDVEAAASFLAALVGQGIKRVLRLELQTNAPARQGRLARCGLVIVNPPFRLAAEAKILLPWLAAVLGRGRAWVSDRLAFAASDAACQSSRPPHVFRLVHPALVQLGVNPNRKGRAHGRAHAGPGKIDGEGCVPCRSREQSNSLMRRGVMGL